MRKFVKRWLKWLAILAVLILLLCSLAVGALITPNAFFEHHKQYRTITVYSDCPIGPEVDSIMTEVFLRLDALPVNNPEQEVDLCLCCTREKFGFFSRLKRGPAQIMGFNMIHTAYVNKEHLADLFARTGGRPKYNTREGSIVHVATHELMHGILSDAYGFVASRRLPEWKSEGYCEYGVNQFVAPRDSGYSIAERIDIFKDDSQWDSAARGHRGHYLWGLMMEYLINVRGMNLEQVMSDSVTLDETYQEMLNWRSSL